jgi:hypothetical protein
MGKGQRRFTVAYCVNTAVCRHGPRHGEQGPIIRATIWNRSWAKAGLVNGGQFVDPRPVPFQLRPRCISHLGRQHGCGHASF